MKRRAGFAGTGLVGLVFWMMAGSAGGAGEGADEGALETLAARLTAGCGATPHRCQHLVYVHSPSMPLSERGEADIVEAAAALGVPVTTLRAEALFEPSADAAIESLRRALVAAGATVHYPAVVVAEGGRPVGNALVGYKRAEVYRTLLQERLASREPSEAAAPAVQLASDGTADVRVLADIELPGPPGAFFRRVPGTRRISFDVRYQVYLHHLETGDRFRAPGRLDFVPSPDGLFFVTPAGRAGTEFYDRRALFGLGERGAGRSLEPFFVDGTMDDEYPSVGILGGRGDRGATRYRVLVAWNRGPAYRDYEVRLRAEGGVAAIEPVGPKTPACPGHDLSLPILSKDGREMSARDERSGTTKIYRIGPDVCEEVLDTEMQTSKATFSEDGRLLAFGARNEGAAARGDARNAVYVLERETAVVTRIPQSLSASLTIPEFVGPDSLLFLVTSRERPAPVQLRLVCCVR